MFAVHPRCVLFCSTETFDKANSITKLNVEPGTWAKDLGDTSIVNEVDFHLGFYMVLESDQGIVPDRRIICFLSYTAILSLKKVKTGVICGHKYGFS